MKKNIKVACICVLGVFVAVTIYLWMTFGSLIKGAMSVEKIDDGLYYMEYKGEDGFEELMARGGCTDIKMAGEYIMTFLSKGFFKTTPIDPPIKPAGCSTVTVGTPEGGVIMGRNFDYPYGNGLIVHTIPDEGYETITTFSTDFWGFGEEYKPEGFVKQYMALSGIFMALDGLNEKGLAVAVLSAGDKVVTRQCTKKPDLTTTIATQYLLRKAANVKEALELLNSIDMNSDPGDAYHIAIADASGKSVVVEYVNNEMMVTETPFVTNHYLCEAKFKVGLHDSDHRHEKLMEQYDQAGGVMSKEQLTETIQSVTQLPWGKDAIIGGTLWTTVMDLKHPSVTYYSRRHFDKPFHFELNAKQQN